MDFNLPEFGSKGVFDTFKISDADVEEAPFLSQSQESQENDDIREEQRMTSPSAPEMTQIMGTMKRIGNSPVPKKFTSSIS